MGREGLILSSVDGVNWTQRREGSLESLAAVTADADRCVAAGSGGHVQVSEEGIRWTAFDTGVPVALLGIASGAGSYVAVGYRSDVISGLSGVLLTSTNGSAWSAWASPVPTELLGVTYGNGRWVAVGYDGVIVTSEDGLHWTTRRSGAAGQALSGIAYGDGQFVAVGTCWEGCAAQSGTILTSEDGEYWTSTVVQGAPALSRVAFGNDRFVAVGGSESDSPALIATSSNGQDWVARAQGTGRLTGVAFGDGVFVAAGYRGGGGRLLTSPDGYNWTERQVSTRPLFDVCYCRGSFIAVGDSGTILQSDPLRDTPPVVLSGPESLTVAPGNQAVLRASAFGSSPLTYRWWKDGQPLDGADRPVLVVDPVQTLDAGSYRVVVSNSFGVATSQTVSLTVKLPAADPPRLSLAYLGQAQVTVWGPPGYEFTLESLDTLSAPSAWQPRLTWRLRSSPWTWVDPQSDAHRQRFYRVRLTP
jgi:hypothetical protein